jgi:hypothetical protein
MLLERRLGGGRYRGFDVERPFVVSGGAGEPVSRRMGHGTYALQLL